MACYKSHTKYKDGHLILYAEKIIYLGNPVSSNSTER